MRLRRFWISEWAATVPGVGVLYLHTALWRPGKLRALGFRPDGRDVVHPVPPGAWEAVRLVVGRASPPPTYEEVMAVIRRAGQQEPPAAG